MFVCVGRLAEKNFTLFLKIYQRWRIFAFQLQHLNIKTICEFFPGLSFNMKLLRVFYIIKTFNDSGLEKIRIITT